MRIGFRLLVRCAMFLLVGVATLQVVPTTGPPELRLLDVTVARATPPAEVGTDDPFRWFIVVRHAEKAAEPMRDPPLTAYGESRAELLQRMLAESGPSVLIATELVRTQRTLEPLANELGLLVDVHESDDPYGMAQQALVLDQPLTVLAAHSDTVVPILQGLTGQDLEHLAPIRYDDLFIVALAGSASSVLRLQYSPGE